TPMMAPPNPDPALVLSEAPPAFRPAGGVDARRIKFSTAFGRGLDYYTGFVFELHDPQGRAAGQLVAGGRYDGLLSRLGSAKPIPAGCFPASVDRLSRRPGPPFAPPSSFPSPANARFPAK